MQTNCVQSIKYVFLIMLNCSENQQFINISINFNDEHIANLKIVPTSK